MVRSTDWGEAALDGELGELARATEGSRNKSLNKAAFRLAQVVGSGNLNRAEVVACLDSTAAGLGLKPRERTIESGLRAGMDQPRGPATMPVVAVTAARRRERWR